MNRSCFWPEPKRRWWGFITGPLLSLARQVLRRYTTRWTVSDRDEWPDDFWHWHLNKRLRPFARAAFPIIRAFYPTAIAQDIVSVQPMTSVTGDDLLQVGKVMDVMESQGHSF